MTLKTWMEGVILNFFRLNYVLIRGKFYHHYYTILSLPFMVNLTNIFQNCVEYIANSVSELLYLQIPSLSVVTIVT